MVGPPRGWRAHRWLVSVGQEDRAFDGKALGERGFDVRGAEHIDVEPALFVEGADLVRMVSIERGEAVDLGPVVGKVDEVVLHAAGCGDAVELGDQLVHVQDVLDHGYRASALRYVLLSVHYRKQMRFTWGILDQAEEALKRLMGCLARLEAIAGDGDSGGTDPHQALGERVETARHEFAEKIDQDLNVPGALGAMFELVRYVNTAIDDGELAHAEAAVVKAAFDGFDEVLGVMALRRVEDASLDGPVIEIEQLISERKAARARRDFVAADAIRDDLVARGVILEDTPAGTRWIRK